MARLILDSGAVIAISRGDERVRTIVKQAAARDVVVVIPAVVVAETTRGGARDASVNRVLNYAHEITVITETTARLAGQLLRRSQLSNATIDALIAAEAIRLRPSVILTSDPQDMSRLVGDHTNIRVVPV